VTLTLLYKKFAVLESLHGSLLHSILEDSNFRPHRIGAYVDAARL